MSVSEQEPVVRIGLAVSQRRNRELLTTLLSQHDVVDLDGGVPEATDLCLVDEASFADLGDALDAWREAQRPTFAPVLLLVDSDTADPWTRYADELSRDVDAVVKVPTPKAEITARLETLVEMREISRELASEHRLIERIFDTSPMAKVVLDADGIVVRANQRAADLFDCPKRALVNQSFHAMDWTPVDAEGRPVPTEERPFTRVVETGNPVYGSEHGLDRPDGQRLWLSVNMAPIRDGTGDIEYVVGALEDVTLRQTQERELERQLDLFAKAQDLANVGAWEYDLRTGAGYWTEEFRDIHGLSSDVEPSPEAAFERYHPADRPVVEAAYERAVDAGEPYDLELRVVDHSGRKRWVRTRGDPQFHGDDVVRVRGTTHDVTDRKERELELRTMTDAVDKAPIGVVLSDPSQADNPMVYVNEGFVQMTGYSRPESVGRNCRFLQGENTDPARVAEISRAIENEAPVSVTLRNYRADGTEFWNSLNISPVRDAEGNVVNWIGFQQDVSERVERRHQLNVIDRYLRHNLRNQLNIVQGTATQIRDEGGPEMAVHADRIDEACSSLLETAEKEREITDLLQEEPTVCPVGLLSILRDTVDDCRRRYPEATISLCGPDAVEATGTEQLDVAFGELIQNSIEHSERDRPHVMVTVTTTSDDVTVSVTDDGSGIPEMEVNVLTGAQEETAVYHGEGLGLWLVYLIARRSGGTLDFPDADGAGGVVTVTLPRQSD